MSADLSAVEASGRAAPPVASPWRLRTLANGVTMARVAVTPVLVVLILRATPSWSALGTWAVLSFSDFVDGWVARRRGPSASGAFLDPLADKLLVLAALFTLVGVHRVPWLPVTLLAGREAVITAYRLAVARQGISVPARPLAKAKTVVELVAVGLVLLPWAWSARMSFAHGVLWAAVVMAWASAAQYWADSRAGRRAMAGA